jgi:hypothetical protein
MFTDRDQASVAQRCLAVVELGKGDLGVCVDVSLLVNPPDAFQITDIERILGTTIARMLALEFAERMFIIRDKRSWMSLLFHLGFLQSGKLGFGEHQPVLGAPGL